MWQEKKKGGRLKLKRLSTVDCSRTTSSDSLVSLIFALFLFLISVFFSFIMNENKPDQAH